MEVGVMVSIDRKGGGVDAQAENPGWVGFEMAQRVLLHNAMVACTMHAGMCNGGQSPLAIMVRPVLA
eukprot:366113-Chlamydomonas_euryale.AAC.5